MLAVAVQLLTGRYVATATHRRDAGEWPPHPARLYSALVATWADADDPSDDERALLEWLEGLPAPEIHASRADERTVVTHFVPVNDASVVGLSHQHRRYPKLKRHLAALEGALEAAEGDLTATKVVRTLAKVEKERAVDNQVGEPGRTNPQTALELLPEGRGRQPRMYPSVTPHDDTVVYVWPTDEPDEATRATLDALLARVVRLGHSSSLVACRLLDAPDGRPRFTPDRRGGKDLRHVGPGQLEALERAFARHQGTDSRALPHVATRYTEAEDETPRPDAAVASVMSGQLIVFRRTGGTQLPIRASLAAARALRGALMTHAEQPACEELSGHVASENGEATRPLERPHAAFVALPFVGREHAKGRLMGFGVLLPAEIDEEARKAVLRAIGAWERAHEPDDLPLQLGRAGVVQLLRVVGRPEAWSLQRRTWARPGRTWVSVTPIALDRHPGDLWGKKPERVQAAFEDAEATIARACRHTGLPEPADVDVSLQPLVAGSRPANAFPPFVQGRGNRAVRRALVHARVRFPVEANGPLLLGAGRYLGLGLMRPADEPDGEG